MRGAMRKMRHVFCGAAVVACLAVVGSIVGFPASSMPPGWQGGSNASDSNQSQFDVTGEDGSIARSEALSPVSNGFAVSDACDGTLCENGVVLVELDDGVSAEEVVSLLEEATGLEGFVAGNAVSGFTEIVLPDELTIDDALGTLSNLPQVGAAQPNFVYFTQDQGPVQSSPGETSAGTSLTATRLLIDAGQQVQPFGPNDPDASEQWAIEAMHLEEAWGIAKSLGAISDTPKQINRTVAVIDEGFVVSHEDLRDCIVDTYDSFKASQEASSSELVDVSPTELGSHGTHAAGVVGAVTNNGIGVAGVSYNAQLQLIRASESGSDEGAPAHFTSESLAMGVEHAIETAPQFNTRVINVSVGGEAVSSGFDTVLTRSIDKAMDNDIVVVCSSGNKSSSADPYVNYPSDHPPAVSVINIAHVSKGDDEYSRSGTSNYNMSGDDWGKDISAPGTSIYGPDNAGGYGWLSGTSMAAPQVAGVLSLMFAVNPDLSASEAVELLYSTATDLNVPANRVGTTFDDETGYGLVNAEAAVKAACDGDSSGAGGGGEHETPDVQPETGDDTFELSRIYGETALDTMQCIVEAGSWDAGGTVVLVTSNGYWDGLTANGVAGLADAPIVMTEPSKLSDQAEAVIRSLRPKTIIICGGTAAISESVEQDAARAAGTSPEIERLWGQMADDTACEIFSRGASATNGAWQPVGFVCTDNGYWDALSAAPISYSKHWPIFLTQNHGAQLSDRTIDAMKTGGIESVYIIGGGSAVDPNVRTQLEDAGVTVVDRIWGQTAVDTSSKVAQFALDQGLTVDNLGVATSNGYWDALAGAAYCGKLGSALIIVDGPNAKTISEFATDNKASITRACIFGGPNAVSTAVEQALKGTIG